MTEMITSGQRKQILRICEDAIDAMEFGKEEVQRVIHKGGELQRRLLDIIKELGKPYADEEIASSYRYPGGFYIRTPREQVKELSKYFPNLDSSYVAELSRRELPEWVDGWAVIPKFEKVGKTYHQALDQALKLLSTSRRFQIWREGTLTEKYLRLKEKTVQVYAKLNEQPGDFWVFPFQFGRRWAGHSVRNVQVRFADNEFGLGMYEVLILLLTHPDRITGPKQLYLNCVGCTYSPYGDGFFYACTHIYWVSKSKLLELSYYSDDTADKQWGAASGCFAPAATNG